VKERELLTESRFREMRDEYGEFFTAGMGAPGAFDFSFSGLKTAVARTVMRVEQAGAIDAERPHLAASFQAAVVDVLAGKALAATAAVRCRRVLLGGGVAANRLLRNRIRDGLGRRGRLFAGSPRLSMDNGAMIARAGLFRLQVGVGKGLEEATARVRIPGMVRWQPAKRAGAAGRKRLPGNSPGRDSR